MVFSKSNSDINSSRKRLPLPFRSPTGLCSHLSWQRFHLTHRPGRSTLGRTSSPHPSLQHPEEGLQQGEDVFCCLVGWLFLNWNWNFESLPLSSVSLGYANVTGEKQQNLQDWNQATFTRILETQPSNLYTLLHEYFLRKESETWEQTSLSCHLS